MCHFIHIAVPIAHAAWFRQQSWPHFSHAPVECTTKHRFAQHARSWAFHATPKTGCSCGSYSQPREKPPANRDDLMARYLAKGWSQAKARRAADQSLSSADLSQPGRLRSELYAVIRDVTTQLGACGVVVEWPNDDKNDPTMYPGKGDTRCSLTEFEAASILEGRFYHITRD